MHHSPPFPESYRGSRSGFLFGAPARAYVPVGFRFRLPPRFHLPPSPTTGSPYNTFTVRQRHASALVEYWQDGGVHCRELRIAVSRHPRVTAAMLSTSSVRLLSRGLRHVLVPVRPSSIHRHSCCDGLHRGDPCRRRCRPSYRMALLPPFRSCPTQSRARSSLARTLSCDGATAGRATSE